MTVRTHRVSSRGQISLPASTRHRWAVEEGSELDIVDLGDGLLILPGGPGAAKRLLADVLTADRYAANAREMNDPDLALE